MAALYTGGAGGGKDALDTSGGDGDAAMGIASAPVWGVLAVVTATAGQARRVGYFGSRVERSAE